MEYPIKQGVQVIGMAKVERQGLYYHFSCRCRLMGQIVHRLTVRCGDKTENLGIPVPGVDAYTLEKRISVSKLGQGEMTVQAVPKHAALGGKFVPLSPEEPFAYLSRLKNAHLARQNGILGIVLEE